MWSPSQDRLDRANLSRFMRFVREEVGNADLNSYAVLYRFSIDQPAKFWTLLWDFVGIRGSGERTPVLVNDDGMALARWFPGVSLNYAQNLLRFDDERIAIRSHGSAEEHEDITYGQLQRRVAVLAAAMRSAGVVPGDRIAALLPNIPDTLVAMLASAAIGATWFACPSHLPQDDALAAMQSVEPALIFSTPERLPLAARLASGRIVVVGPTGDLEDFARPFEAADIEFEALPFDHPLYLTCTQVNRGARELLMHGAGGTLIQHLKELVLHVDLRREDKVFFHAGTDTMAWYWLASSLATGATLVLHSGDELPPHGAALWDLLDEYGISVLGVHSQWLDAAAGSGLKPMESHRLLALKTILTAGARLSPAAYEFVYRDLKQRVLLAPISTGGDTLACFALGAPVLPVYLGEIPCRGLAMRVEVLDSDHEPVVGDVGDLCCTAPFPSMPIGFFDDADSLRYDAAYFSRHPGVWCHGERATLTTRESLIPD